MITDEKDRKHNCNGKVFSQYRKLQSAVYISQDVVESNLLNL